MLRLKDAEINLVNFLVKKHWVVEALQTLTVLYVRSYDDQFLHSLVIVDLAVQCHYLGLVHLALVEALHVSWTLLNLEKHGFEGSDAGILILFCDACLFHRLILLDTDVVALDGLL